MRENTDQNNSEYEHFSRSENSQVSNHDYRNSHINIQIRL